MYETSPPDGFITHLLGNVILHYNGTPVTRRTHFKDLLQVKEGLRSKLKQE